MDDEDGARGPDDELSENEGSLLALVLRLQPVKPYQLLKIYLESPVSRYNASSGSVYPLVKRLEKRGLIESDRLRGDRRKAKLLRCTPAGHETVRRWVAQISVGQVLLDDPWRSRILSFGELDREQQLEWVARARLFVIEKARELEIFNSRVDLPYQEVAHDNARLAIEARLKWLDALSATLVETEPKRQ
ncbi:MAG: PadR family transcriptional regulator [Sphingomonas sp.]